MGSLTPGASYIYERDGDTIYAREFGSSERRVIGIDYPYGKKTLGEQHNEEMMWKDILRKAESNTTLKLALDRVIMIYKLSEEKLK